MNVTVALNATAETKDVLVYTSSGADTLTDGFTIEQETQPTTNSPTITAINPTSGQQGKMLNVTITGIDLTGAIEVSLGTDVTVNLYTVNSATQITANITVATDATAGTRDVSVTTPTGSDTLAASFTVEVATPTEPTASTGCGASAAAASVTDIVSGWGLIGLLGTSSIFIHRKQKKRKSK